MVVVVVASEVSGSVCHVRMCVCHRLCVVPTRVRPVADGRIVARLSHS